MPFDALTGLKLTILSDIPRAEPVFCTYTSIVCVIAFIPVDFAN